MQSTRRVVLQVVLSMLLLAALPQAALAAPGVFVVESGGTTDVVEGGMSDTVELALEEAPAANVDIWIAMDAQTSVAPGWLTFTPANWNVPQVVMIDAVDDAIDEPDPHFGITSFLVLSADINYDALAVPDLVTVVSDNDVAGVTVSESAGSTDAAEGGVTDSLDYVLDSEPVADVTITFAPDAQVATSVPSITFTIGNWNIPQTVDVTAVDDLVIEGAHTGAVSHSVTSADIMYDGLAPADVSVNITDNDIPDIILTESAGSTDVAEGGATDNYELVLASQPTADVAITVSGDADVTGSPTMLIFTPANWMVPQTVIASAVDDFLVEPTHIGVLSHSVASADPNYNGFPVPGVVATVIDNDEADIFFAESGGSTDLTEGGASDTYTIVIGSQPTADVTINLGADAQVVDDQGGAVVFTSANWNVPQTVTLTAVDDAVIEPSPHTGVVTHVSSSVDPWYAALAGDDITANITDNDPVGAAGVTVTESGGSTDVVEGGASDTVSVVLDMAPVADVVISAGPDAQVATDAPSLTFTAANWNVPQVLTIDAVDDFLAEASPHSGMVGLTVTSADIGYDGLAIADVSANIVDNDVAGVVVSESGGSTDVTEGGANDTYDVLLQTEPTSDVSVTLIPDAQVSVDVPLLTFSAANWNVPQTVTVSAIDDVAIEGSPHAGAVMHTVTSADPFHDGLVVSDVAVNITDNDAWTPGVTVTESGGSTDVAEGGAGDSIDILLDSPPAADVTISLAPDAQVSTAPASVVFTAANWNVPQSLSVDAVDDAVAEASPHSGQLGIAVASADAGYNALPVADVTVSITDNDVAGVTLVPGSVNVAEGGATATYDLVLDSQPTATVVINISSGGEHTTGPGSAVFTPANWNVPQSITVTAIDDNAPEGAHVDAATHAVSSTDPQYDGMVVGDVSVNIADNDTAGLQLAATDGSTAVTENGAGDTALVSLSAAPSADVTVTVSSDAQVAAAPAVLVFTAANWNTPQTISLTAIDDVAIEGNHTGDVSFALTSTDPAFDASSVPDLAVAIADDDGASATPVISIAGFSGFGVNGNDATASGSTIWFNPNVSSAFTVNVATSIGTGAVASVNFPPLGAGWSPAGGTSNFSYDGAGGYRYTYSWSPGAASATSVLATANSGAGRSASVPFSVIADSSTPSSGSITWPSRSRTVLDSDSLVVRWNPGSDGGSGVSSTDVRFRSRNNRGSWTSWQPFLTGTSATSHGFNGSWGQTYCFQTRSSDGVGNTSGWSPQRCAVIPVNSTQSRFSGWATRGGRGHGWRPTRAGRYMGNHAQAATRRGAQLRFPASRGSRMRLVVTTCSRCGRVRVQVAGTRARTINLRSRGTRSGRSVLIYRGSASRARAVTITALDNGKPVIVEGLIVEP